MKSELSDYMQIFVAEFQLLTHSMHGWARHPQDSLLHAPWLCTLLLDAAWEMTCCSDPLGEHFGSLGSDFLATSQSDLKQGHLGWQEALLEAKGGVLSSFHLSKVMAQWLRALAALTEDPEAMWQLIILWNSSWRGSNVLFWPPWTSGMQVVHGHICRLLHPYTLKKIKIIYQKRHQQVES